MSQPNDWTLSVPAHVSWSTNDGEILVFNELTEEICGLDGVAADAFRLLIDRGRLLPTVDALRDVYAVDRATLERDITTLVCQLEASGLVRVVRVPPTAARGNGAIS